MLVLRTPQEAAAWFASRQVLAELNCDSRKVGSGDGFIAWPGAATDGRKFVPATLQQGARACLVEAAGSEAFGFTGDAVAAYEGLKAATGPIAALFYGEPTQALDVLAVTGTNGKTSTAWWLAQALSNAGVPCGVIGTLGVGQPPKVEHTGLTTPDPVLLQVEAVPAASPTQACSGLRARGFLHRHRRAAHGRHAGAGGGLHQFHPGPPGLPRHHGSLLAGQGGVVPLARPAGRGPEHRRRQGRRAGRAVAAGRRTGRLDGVLRARRAPAGAGHRLRPARPALRDRRGQRAPRTAHRADRPVQRFQPAGRRGDDACRRRTACEGGGGLRGPAARARPHGAHCLARQAAGGGGLCPYARCAGQGPAGPAPTGGAARRPAVVRVRLRWRPRPDQAAADGGGGGEECRSRGRHQRQPAQREAGSDHQPDPAGAVARSQRRSPGRSLLRDRGDGGRRRSAGRDPAGRQGPRGLPGDRRRQAPVLRPGARAACPPEVRGAHFSPSHSGRGRG